MPQYVVGAADILKQINRWISSALGGTPQLEQKTSSNSTLGNTRHPHPRQFVVVAVLSCLQTCSIVAFLGRKLQRNPFFLPPSNPNRSYVGSPFRRKQMRKLIKYNHSRGINWMRGFCCRARDVSGKNFANNTVDGAMERLGCRMNLSNMPWMYVC